MSYLGTNENESNIPRCRAERERLVEADRKTPRVGVAALDGGGE
jgi:hypothetical protein